VPGQSLMYLYQRDTPPHQIDYIGEHNWSSGAIVFDITDPEVLPWGTSHPGCVTFYKGRQYVGGTRENPIGIWASAPGEYLTFAIPDPPTDPTDADPMYLPIDTHGEVVWLLGVKALFVGMDTGEHLIFGVGGAVPTPANVDTEQQSAYGSARVQAEAIGEQVAYVTPDRRKLYISSYSRDDLGWISEDVSYPSEHITKGLLREIELSGTPDQVLWFPTLEGKLVGMTYDPRRKIIGWHRHETQGFIVTATVIKNRGIAELWIATLRDVDGVSTLMFERSDPEFKLDSFREFEEVVPQVSFSGFDHLEGQTVQVLADGAVHPDVVVSGGAVALQYPATHVAVGLGYLAKIRTLPIDMLSQDESRASYMKSWVKIFVRLLDSSLPLIDGERPPVREEETPMGERQPNETHDVEVAHLGWDLYGAIDIEQDLPLHLTVMGVFGELDQDNI